MKQIILFDSDVVIDVLRGDAVAEALLTGLAGAGPVGVSVVSRMETIRGCQDRETQQRVERLLCRFVVLSIDEAISRRADELVNQYFLSHNIAIADALIAATALVYNLPLLSKNQRDYRFIPDLNLLPYPTAT